MNTNPPNPNGANGTTSDPREQVMWDIYVKNLKDGIDNAYKAAKESGYEEESAKHITLRRWFLDRKDKMRRTGMLSKAERNLEKALDTSWNDEDGNAKTDVMRIVMDVSKTIATTLGKDEGYSSRTENTGKDGKDLPTPIMQIHVQDNNSNQENSSTD